MKIVSVAQMRALEAAAFASGVTEAVLQERAGAVVAEEAHRRVQPGDRVAVLVGHGNNGRDGAVAARWLLNHGARVDLVLCPRHAVTADELTELRRLGASLVTASDGAAVRALLDSAAVAIDALLGIGASGPLREPLATLARQLNATRELRVIALDIPSGVDADSGEVAGEAVRADSTVTLGAVKQGLLRFPAATHVGRLIGREIGLDDAALPFEVLDRATLRDLVPPRPLDAHKYRFGRTLIVAGSDHFLGAPVLCATAAARTGAGLVTVGSTRDVRLNVAAHVPEATFTIADVDASANSDATPLHPYLESHNALVVGPGLGRGPRVTQFVETLLRQRPPEHFAVVDADALVALSEIDQWPALLDANVVLTPHSGELARLAGAARDQDQAPWEQAARLAQAWGCVLIAKGPFTAIAAPDGHVSVWPSANSALATGGTGDVLAGICGGLLAQGLSGVDAARLAVGVHALAAEKIVAQRSWRTLLASDLPQAVPAVLAELTQPR